MFVVAFVFGGLSGLRILLRHVAHNAVLTTLLQLKLWMS